FSSLWCGPATYPSSETDTWNLNVPTGSGAPIDPNTERNEQGKDPDEPRGGLPEQGPQARDVADQFDRSLRVELAEGEDAERLGPDRDRVDARPGLQPSGEVRVWDEGRAGEDEGEDERERRRLHGLHGLQREARERGDPR